MDYKTTLINGKKVDTLTLIDRTVDNALYTVIASKTKTSTARAKYYVGAYILGRTTLMAAHMVAERFNLPLPLCVAHMDIVDDILNGTVE